MSPKVQNVRGGVKRQSFGMCSNLSCYQFKKTYLYTGCQCEPHQLRNNKTNGKIKWYP